MKQLIICLFLIIICATQIWAEKLHSSNQSAIDYYEKGILCKKSKKYDDAYDLFVKALQQDKEFSDAYRQIGNIYLELNRIDMAMSMYNKTLQINPKDSMVYNNIGAIYVNNLNNKEEAIKYFTIAIEMDPDQTLAYSGRASTYLKLGEYEKAKRDVQYLISKNADNENVHIDMGNWLNEVGDHHGAIEHFRRAEEINPKEPFVYHNRAIAYLKLGLHEKALKDSEQALRLRKFPAAYNTNGNILAELTRHEDALQSFDAALKMSPDYYSATLGKGYALYNLGMYEESVKIFQRALALEPAQNQCANKYLNISKKALDCKLGKNADCSNIPKTVP